MRFLSTCLILCPIIIIDAIPDAAGWSPIDQHGVVRYSALGLFEGSELTPTIATVRKHPGNPLFGQDKPWEPRIDNGYPNVVYDPESVGDGPWRLWYGGIGTGGQYLYYANSTDGLHWDKPILNRYDLANGKWPAMAQYGTKNNIVMLGGGIGIYHDVHEPNPALRYKATGGAPPGCWGDDGASHCATSGVTAGSPDGINHWTDVFTFDYPKEVHFDCHTNLFYDVPLQRYLMTLRTYVPDPGRLISVSQSGGVRNGNWSVSLKNKYPPTIALAHVHVDPAFAAQECGHQCLANSDCYFFWVYTTGTDAGDCFLKSAILPGPLEQPACTSCGGLFFKMTTQNAPVSGQNGLGGWSYPTVSLPGNVAHQLYSQITWRFYDIFLGVVMVFDAQSSAGRVHCMLAWSRDFNSNNTWQWVDPSGLDGLREFIPQGPDGSFDSHICFAAYPLKMGDGSTRMYYMGGNGPHSGQRDSAFGLATLPPDRFGGLSSSKPVTAKSRQVTVTGMTLIITLDVRASGSVTVELVGQGPEYEMSNPIVSSGTDVAVRFPNAPAGLDPLVGKDVVLQITVEDATVYTFGFM